MKKYFICMLFLCVACAATREPMPVKFNQIGDDNLTCEQIEVLYKTNTTIAKEKIYRNIQDDKKDILRGFWWPGLVDLKNADGVEGNALLDRNIYLINIAKDKGCDVSGYPDQPERYE